MGLVPFTMSRVTLRGAPPLPWLSRFPEMNLRLYVERDGKPGIWFISLDTSRSPAVWAARRFVHLPYYLADMSLRESDDGVSYRSSRRGPTRVEFAGRYRPTGPVRESCGGSIEHFLTERGTACIRRMRSITRDGSRFIITHGHFSRPRLTSRSITWHNRRGSRLARHSPASALQSPARGHRLGAGPARRPPLIDGDSSVAGSRRVEKAHHFGRVAHHLCSAAVDQRAGHGARPLHYSSTLQRLDSTR